MIEIRKVLGAPTTDPVVARITDDSGSQSNAPCKMTLSLADEIIGEGIDRADALCSIANQLLELHDRILEAAHPGKGRAAVYAHLATERDLPGRGPR